MNQKQHKPGCKINIQCLVYHQDGVCPGPYGTCTCDEITDSNTKPQANLPEVNYMQVGRTIKCGHCHPKEFGEGLKRAEELILNYKCECKCHDTPSPERSGDWEDELELLCQDLEGDFIIKLNDFIRKLRQEAVEDSRREQGLYLRAIAETLKGNHDKDKLIRAIETEVKKLLKSV